MANHHPLLNHSHIVVSFREYLSICTRELPDTTAETAISFIVAPFLLQPDRRDFLRVVL